MSHVRKSFGSLHKTELIAGTTAAKPGRTSELSGGEGQRGGETTGGGEDGGRKKDGG